VERDGKNLLEWIQIHSLKGLPGLAGPELGFLRTSTASVLRNDACLRLPARNTGLCTKDHLFSAICGTTSCYQRSFPTARKMLLSPIFSRNPSVRTLRSKLFDYKRVNGASVENINIFFDRLDDPAFAGISLTNFYDAVKGHAGRSTR
jgi:hypothetical protein